MGKDSGYRRIGDILVTTGLLTEAQLKRALEVQRTHDCRLGEAIVRDGLLSQDQLNWALAQHFGLPYVDVQVQALDRDLVRSLRPGLLYQHRVVPLVRIGDTITLAMADPTDMQAVHEVAETTRAEVQCAIAGEHSIVAALEEIFTLEELHLGDSEGPSPSRFAKMVDQPTPRRRLGEILMDALLITRDQLATALKKQSQNAKRLGEIFIEDRICTEDQINWALARHLDVPYIDLSADMVDPSLADLVPQHFLEEHLAVPMMRLDDQLVVAMADPLDEEVLHRIATTARCPVTTTIAPRRAIRSALAHIARLRGAAAGPAGEELQGIELAEPTAEMGPRGALSPDAAQAFKETLQQNPLPLADKIKVYSAVRRIVKARQEGGPGAARIARQQSFQSLTDPGMKLALQLANQVGNCDVPIVKDDEFTASYGAPGVLEDADRRFIIDRRTYERTIRSHTQRYGLSAVQVDNAVMAARAHVLSGGKQKILLIAEGERQLAVALTRVIRLARTREPAAPDDAKAPQKSPPPPKPAERRETHPKIQKAVATILADCTLPEPSRAKVIRAFRFIHESPGGAAYHGKLKQLFQRGTFAGFSADEIRILERLLRAHGYDLG